MKKITLLVCCFTFLLSIQGICSNAYTLQVTVYGNPANMDELNATGYSINGIVMDYNACGANPSIHIAIIDSTSCNPLNNCNKYFNQDNIFTDQDGDCVLDANTTYNCIPRPQNFFIYRTLNAFSIRQMAQLLDSVENGHIIIAYSMWPLVYSAMDTAFKNVFQRLGSVLISAIPDTVPFIFVCRKGDAGSVHETIGTMLSDSIGVSMTYQCSPTGIDVSGAGAFSVYPNPVNDNLHISFKKDFKEGEIKIYDALGNLVSAQKHVEGDMILSTEKFSPGIYFVRIESENHFSTVRFCKTE